jgi:putative RNA 2'-phosphotransferase
VNRATRISKYLSLVLRHDPAAGGVSLDEQGWTSVADLLAGASARGLEVSAAELAEVVRTSDKQRFALSSDGLRVRANQGHSVAVDLGLAPAEPPATLFHGTVERFVAAILAEGLRKQARQHLHLSPDVETARRVGTRRGMPVVLRVDAARMHAEGLVFLRSENGVWLTEAVPPRFIERLPREAGR